MNKTDLIEVLSPKLGGKAAATKAIEAFTDAVTRSVTSGEKVAISGFGVFEKADRAARTGRNPATGAVVKIKKTSVPKFRPGSDFKAYVAGTKKFAKVSARAAKAAPVAKATPVKVAAKAPVKTVTKAPAKVAAKAPAKVAVKAPVKTVTKAPAKVAAAKAPAKTTTTKAVSRPAAKTTAAKAPAKTTTAKVAPRPTKTAARKTTPVKRGR